MARIDIYEGTLVLRLSLVERRSGFVHGDARIPLDAVRAVRTVDDPWAELRGMRSPGSLCGKSLAVGTWRFPGGKDFVALHGRGPGVVVELDRPRVRPDPLLVLDPEADATWIDASGGRSRSSAPRSARRQRNARQSRLTVLSGDPPPAPMPSRLPGRCDARVPVSPRFAPAGRSVDRLPGLRPVGCGPRARRRAPREPARARSGRGCPGRTRARSAARPRRAGGLAPSGRRAPRG